MKNEAKEPILILDCHHGVYIPQLFAQQFGPVLNKHNRKDKGLRDDIEDLLRGPDNEHYWDAWDSMLSRDIILSDNQKYTLVQDNDLWLLPDGVEWPE